MALAESASRFELAPRRENFSHIPEVLPLPNLIQTQTDSFEWFVTTGLRELLDEITPITDFTGKNLELHFREYYFEEPKFSEEECRTRDLTYAKPLKVEVDLVIKETDEVKHQTVFMGDFPWMTDQGTFIINGAERVVVSQLVRSPGVYYTAAEDPSTGRMLHAAKVIPNRGAWLEFETSNKDLLSVKVDRKRKIPVTTLLRAVGLETDEIQRILGPADDNPEHPYVQLTLDKDPAGTQDEALVEVYKKLRPGDPPTVENARALVTSLFFNFRRYDLGRVGRYKLNKALGEVADKLKITLPAEESANPRESPRHQPRRHRRHRRQAHRAQQRPRRARRHRPSRQPAHPRQRRADPEPVPHRPAAHGARGQGADDDHRCGPGDAEHAHQHPPGRGGDEGVLRRQPAEPVHGSDQPAGRADEQATPLRARPRWPEPRARRLRRPRRAPVPLRPDVPDRDAGGPEHRPDRLAGDLRQDQPPRLHRDAVPQGSPLRRRQGQQGRRAGPGPGRGPRAEGRQQAGRQGGHDDRREDPRADQGCQGGPGPDPSGRHRGDRLPRCLRGGEVPHRAGQCRAR